MSPPGLPDAPGGDVILLDTMGTGELLNNQARLISALREIQNGMNKVPLVICPDPAIEKWARQPIPTGHPGFGLAPLVIDADSAPPPGAPGPGWAAPELAVLAALTGAVDLEEDAARRMVLSAIAAAGSERLETYTRRSEPVDAIGELLRIGMLVEQFVEQLDVPADRRVGSRQAGVGCEDQSCVLPPADRPAPDDGHEVADVIGEQRSLLSNAQGE